MLTGKDIVKTCFRFGEWILDTPLPIKGRPDAMSYAQKMSANACYRYLHSLDIANLSARINQPLIDYVSNPDQFETQFPGFFGEINGLTPEALHTSITKEPTVKDIKKPTPQTPVAIKFLQSFCQSAKIFSMWELQGDEDSRLLKLIHNAEVNIGLLLDYFNETGLACEWRNTELIVSLNQLNNWHIEVFSEAQGGVNAVNNEIEKFIEKENTLKKILSIVQTIMGVSQWSATPKGLECTLREMAKNEDVGTYEAKCSNIALLLAWTQVKCGLTEKMITSSHLSNVYTLQIGYEVLNNKHWSNLSDALLKNSRKLGSSISQITSKIDGIIAIDALLAEENKKLSLLKQKPQPDEGKITPNTAIAQRQPETKKSEKKAKKQDKRKKPNLLPKSVALATPTNPGKKKNDKKSGPILPPQDERRLQAIEEIRPASHQNLSAAPNRGIDLSLFSPPKPENKPLESKSNDVIQKLPAEIGSQELLILDRLEYWINQMNNLPQDVSIDTTAAWQDIHSQIAGLLSILRDDHPAKKFIFNQHLYYGKRTFDRQKHTYFPDCLASNKCVQDLGSLLGAITLLSQEHYPLDSSIADANRIIHEWSRYLETEFANNDITKLTLDMDQHAFSHWISHKVADYSLRIKNLLNRDHNVVALHAIRFYVNRVGELTGHIPKPARTAYLQFCRDFRNNCFHNHFDLIEIDMEKLQRKFQTQSSPRFFRQDSKLLTWELYINNSYEYQLEDMKLLTDLQTLEIEKRTAKSVPVITCEPVKTFSNRSLYKLFAKNIAELDQKVNEDCAYGMLLIPLEIASKQTLHTVLAMKFIRLQNDKTSEFQLKEICYAPVFENNVLIKEYIESQVKEWMGYNLQKNTPAIKLHESIN